MGLARSAGGSSYNHTAYPGAVTDQIRCKKLENSFNLSAISTAMRAVCLICEVNAIAR